MDKHNSQIWTQKQKRCNMNCSVICVIDTGPGPGKFSQCESSSMASTTLTNRPLVSSHVGDRKLFCFTCDGEQDDRTEDPINGYFNCAEIFNLTYYSFSLNISKLSSIRFNVIIFYIRYLICLYQITVMFIHLMRVITVYSIWRVRDRSVIRITEITS